MIVTLQVDAQAEAIDPAATHTLQQMTDYFGSLKQCGLHTQNTREDLLDSGQRVDLDISGNVIVSRPNMLGAERKGVLLDQAFHYDGKSLALHSPTEKVVVTEPAPATIEERLDYKRESLGGVPAAGLIYRTAAGVLESHVST